MKLNYALISLLGPFLFFQMEFLAANILLPHFGGSYHIWLTCIFFYTLVLFLGYLFTSFIGVNNRFNGYRYIHFFSMIASLALLYFNSDLAIVSTGDKESLEILILLSKRIGIPLFLLSMTTPLTQLFYTKEHNNKKVFHLISYSNMGSMIGLVSYPFFFNLVFDLDSQQTIWFFTYSVFVLLHLPIILKKFKVSLDNKSTDKYISTYLKNIDFKSIACSFIACSLMLSVTNYITLGIGPIPLVWMIPLAIFTLTFILNFKEKPLYSDRVNTFLILLWLGLHFSSQSMNFGKFNLLSSLSYYLFLFLTNTILCRYIYLRRPKDLAMTPMYNLSINLGGFLGTVFVTFFATHISQVTSNIYIELLISIFLFFIFLLVRDYKKILSFTLLKSTTIGILGVLVFLFITNHLLTSTKKNIYYIRNFYGINRVIDDGKIVSLISGKTKHGGQHKSKKLKEYPLYYYHPQSPVADIFNVKKRTKNVAIIGLGTGALSYYAKENQIFDYFEIDPDVIKIANEYFSFIKDSSGKIKMIVGDGRLMINQSSIRYDLIIIDAFSSDFVPVHLVSKEAIQIYLNKLAPKGLLSFHISNKTFNLKTILGPIAKSLNLQLAHKVKTVTDHLGTTGSEWAIMTNDSEIQEVIVNKYSWKINNEFENFPVWTDKRRNILLPIFY